MSWRSDPAGAVADEAYAAGYRDGCAEALREAADDVPLFEFMLVMDIASEVAPAQIAGWLRARAAALDAAPSSQTGGVGTGAGEGATGQDTGTAWVTRSTDCPEAPAQAHPLAAPIPLFVRTEWREDSRPTNHGSAREAILNRRVIQLLDAVEAVEAVAEAIRVRATCATCSGRGVWMDEPCDDCQGTPA